MARTTGIHTEGTIERSNTQIEGDMGWIESMNHVIDFETDQLLGISGNSEFQYHSDNVVNVEHGVTFRPDTFEVFELMGTDNTGTVSLDESLPSFTVRMKIAHNPDIILILENAKYGSFEFSVDGPDSDVNVDFSGLAIPVSGNAMVKDTTISPNDPGTAAIQGKDLLVKIDGSTIGSVDSFAVGLDRGLRYDNGITDKKNKLIPEETVAGRFTWDLDISFRVDDDNAYREVFDSSTNTYALPSPTRSNVSVTIETQDGNNSFPLTDVRFNSVEQDYDNSDDTQIVTITGSALSNNSISYG